MNFYNIGVEKAVLASLMSIEGAYPMIANNVDTEDFIADKHKTIFRAIKELALAGEPYDSVMVYEWVESHKLVAAIGGEGYLAEILSASPATMFNLVAYAERVQDFSRHRLAAAALADADAVMKEGALKLNEKISTIIESLTGIATGGKDENGYSLVSDMMGAFFNRLEQSAVSGMSPFLPTGFYDLDQKAPIEKGDLVVIGARPSMGKTTLALNILQNMVEYNLTTDDDGNRARKVGVMFSLEMTKDAVMQRFMTSQAGVQFSNVRSGKNLDEDDWANLMKAATKYQEDYPLVIDDRSRLTHQDMRAALNKIRHEQGEIGEVVIDYLQFMGGIDANNATSSIGEITGALKAMAKEFDCPIFLLSQLNRSLESRPNKRPVASDLRDSGTIEQDADLIFFLYRDEVYNEQTEYAGLAEVIVAKNRQGEIGTVRLGFEGHYSRFVNNMPMYNSGDDMPDFGE